MKFEFVSTLVIGYVAVLTRGWKMTLIVTAALLLARFACRILATMHGGVVQSCVQLAAGGVHAIPGHWLQPPANCCGTGGAAARRDGCARLST